MVGFIHDPVKPRLCYQSVDDGLAEAVPVTVPTTTCTHTPSLSYGGSMRQLLYSKFCTSGSTDLRGFHRVRGELRVDLVQCSTGLALAASD